MSAPVAPPDPFDARRARHADGLLAAFNEVGVLTAADGQRGLDLMAAEGHRISLAIADYAMPGMTGWEVAARLRAEHNDELAILVTSADAHVLTGGRPGPMLHDDYLVKPLQLPDLFEKLQLLLDLEWVMAPAERAAAQGPDAEAFLG